MADQRTNQSYNIEAVRQLLLAAVTAEELSRFCFDHAAFRPIVHNFGPKYSMNDMVDEVLVYCEARALVDQLLVGVRQINPAQYARFEDHLHDPGYTPPAIFRRRSIDSAELKSQPPKTAIARFLGRKERTVTLTHAQQRRNRENLLHNVKATWIDGYLHHAVHHSVYMELGIEYKRDAVSRPWNLVLQPANEPIPQDRSISDVFAKHGRSLLILGEPASGKTITLLQLAKDLVAQAQRDKNSPIPVILNLSSWARERLPLVDWLIDEIFVAYQVARPLVHVWLQAGDLVLLLDGLDEVDEACRDGCVAAINGFKGEQAADIVVCSRSAEYTRLSESLNLSTAICIQPLSLGQIDEYLRQFGLGAEGIRVALRQDKDLQELAQSPLMLSLMSLTYTGLEQAQIASGPTLEDTRRRFLSAYVRRAFQHRNLPADRPYDQPQALHWLGKLAQGMVHHGQSVFYIERLQPTWLSGEPAHRQYRFTIDLALCLLVELGIGLFIGLFFGLGVAIFFGLYVGAVIGAITWLGSGLLLWLGNRRHWLRSTIALSEEVHRRPSLPHRELLRFAWWWSRTLIGWLVIGGIVGAGIGLMLEFFLELSSGFHAGLSLGLIGGLASGLFRGLASIVLMCTTISETRQRVLPNQGIRASLRNAWLLGSLYWLVGAFTGGLAGALTGQPSLALSLGFCVGASSALQGALLEYRGFAVLQHYTLRFLLSRQDVIPFPFSDHRLIAFLDAMADRILLRRVGGGWMFIHRYLLEYFASLETEETQS